MSRREPDLETGIERRPNSEKGPSSVSVSDNENPYFPSRVDAAFLEDLKFAIQSLEDAYDKSLGRTDTNSGARKSKQNFFSKLKRRSPPIRYAVYLSPLVILLVIPIAVLGTVFRDSATLPGLPTDQTPPNPGRLHAAGLVVWLEIVVVALWVASTVAWLSITSFNWGCDIFKDKLKTRQLLFDALKNISTDLMALPITLIIWTILSFATTSAGICVMDVGRCDDSIQWISTVKTVFKAGIVVSFILWIERFLIGVSFISYYGKQYDHKHEVLQSDIGQINNLFYLTLHRPPKHEHKIHRQVAQTCQDCKKSPKVSDCLSLWKDDWNEVFNCTIRKEESAVHLATYLWYAIKLDQTYLPPDISDEAATSRLKKDILTSELKDWVCRDEDKFPPDIRKRIFPYSEDEFGDDLLTKGFTDILNGDNDSDIQYVEMQTAIKRLGKRAETLEKTLHNVREAMESLDRPLSVIVLIAVAFVYAAFFVPNFNTYATAIFTAFTGLGFALSGTITDFLGSCIFLFVKHPYYVGDRIEINRVQLYVERIALMTTRFSRVDNGKFVQLPHSLLNTYWIENLTRSKVLKEYLTIAVSPDTTFETIEAIEEDLKIFVERNERDFKKGSVAISLSSINDLTQLKLDIEVEHKFKYFDDDVHNDRQVRFKRALLSFLREREVLPPNVDPIQIGDPWRPTYAINSNAEDLALAQNKFKADQTDVRNRRKADANHYREPPSPRRSHAGTPLMGFGMTPRSTY